LPDSEGDGSGGAGGSGVPGARFELLPKLGDQGVGFRFRAGSGFQKPSAKFGENWLDRLMGACCLLQTLEDGLHLRRHLRGVGLGCRLLAHLLDELIEGGLKLGEVHAAARQELLEGVEFRIGQQRGETRQFVAPAVSVGATHPDRKVGTPGGEVLFVT